MERPSPRTAASRTTRRRISQTLAVICSLAVATGPAVSPLAHADDLKKRKHHVEKGIKNAAGDLDESSKALSAATKQLSSARTQLAAAERTLAASEGQLSAARVLDAQMQAKLAQAVQALADAELEVTKGTEAVKEQRAEIGRMVADNYQSGDPRLLGLSMMLTATDPEELASQLGTVDSLMDRETSMFDDLTATQAMLEVQKAKVEKAKIEVAERRRAAAANLVRRQALERAATKDRARVASLVSRRRTAEARARHIRAADMRKLRQLKRQEARIKRLILRRARKHHGGSYSGDTGGFLYRPVPGAITSPYGWRRHPIYGYWGLHNGTDFSAPCGTPMHAGASGTVISEYYSSVWGNRLFLDVGRVNGKTMTLVYNHASSYRARTGAHVGRGDVVAYAGTTGWSTGCHLHFSVLLNGNPVDPARYL